ncbi:MAG: hypothetical protein AAF594_12610 [Bacteroidota bacterium]
MTTSIHRLALLALGLLLTGCVSSGVLQRTEHTHGPLRMFDPLWDVDVEAYAEANEGRDGVFLRIDQTDEHAFDYPSWEYVEERTAQYLVLNPEAEWLTTQSIRVQRGGRLIGVASRVTSPDGTVRAFTEADYTTERDGDATVYKLAYTDIQRGSIVEEAYRVLYEAGPDYSPPLAEDYRMVFPLPVDSLRIRYIYPQNWGLQIKRMGRNDYPVGSVEIDPALDKRILTYERADVPAYEDEPFSPYFKETAEYLELRVTGIQDRLATYAPPDTWGALAEDFAKYAFRKGGLFSNPVGNAAREAVPDEAVSDSMKLVQVVDWVQRNIEIGESRNDDFTSVVRQKRGNPLLITGLTQAMLDRVGVEAEYYLIHPRSEGFFDDQYVTGSQFPIPAVGTEIDGHRYVVFPFIEGLPVNYVPEEFQGARAMRITPDGFGGFTDIPDRDVDSYAVDETYDVEIDADGILHVEEVKTLRGIAAYANRKRFEDLDDEEREDEIRELLTYTEGDVDDLEYDLVRLGEYGTDLEIRIRYTIDNLVTLTPEEILFQTGGLLSPASLSAFKVDTRERTLPVRIYYDQITNKRIRLRFPEAWSLTTDLTGVDYENRFGRVTGLYEMAPGEIVATQQIHLRESSAPASTYASLLRLTGSESALYVPTLVFSVDS